jgi:NADP-dependent 3-hydroxy acid dehydrogenase YdfG
MDLLKNKVAIVTGAGTGIGQAIAVEFVKVGAAVAFIGRRLDKLQEAVQTLPPERVLLLSVDVADRAAVNAAVGQVETHFGPVDILVNNAGTNTNPRSVGEVNPTDWDRTIAINLTGTFNCIRAVLPGMRARRDGLIINVSSIAGVRASQLAGAAYSASKHGMVALTHSLNAEEKDYGIRASVICPGEVNTPILDLRPEPVGPERRRQILQPEDLAAAALFIATLPPRACVPELIITPTTQNFR